MGGFAWGRRGLWVYSEVFYLIDLFPNKAEIRKEFAKLDTDGSGFITKGDLFRDNFFLVFQIIICR